MRKKILSHSVSQELNLIWLWLLVHMCKMMISPAFFFFFFRFFKILIFQVFQSSSINAKSNFWSVPHLLHMFVIFVSILNSLDTQVMLVLTLIDVNYSHKVVFSFGKGLNCQNYSSGSYHPEKNRPPAKFPIWLYFFFSQ